ncbi:alpha/beta hydrolase [Pseudomaricurvus alkylphenolicus]|uniref:alpha/beta hydrolase n=1 Tax=Pseudomaricurvus alkylphenolicus TaxID=1306991 RepID=UPI001424A793|nr:alpha/beta hydrolase [Pseudomaricurvus alkylphenolicus]NIB42422.1 alpha/beta hydrolase [Pseudomaricurvus alkylphenolicus]
MKHVYINPQTQVVIDQLGQRGLDEVSEHSIEEIRESASKLFAELGPANRDVYKDEYIFVPGPEGDIRCRMIVPREPTAPMPVLLYFIGGTFAHKTAYEFGGTPHVLATEANCIMIIPEHRLPPENRYPAAFDDCYAVYKWLLRHAGEINGDVRRIAVGGGSSAGNIAATVCQDAKADGIPQPVLQWLDVPLLDHMSETPSVQQMDYLVDRDSLRFGSDILFGDQEWALRASPLRAPDVSGLAPAYITTAELDPLVDEARAYAIRLRNAGVPTTYICYEGQIHGFSGMGGIIDEGLMMIYQAAGVLRYAFSKGR